MKREQIDLKDASVAATFYEPVYQRLRVRYRGQEVHLLCFVEPTGRAVREALQFCAAAPCHAVRTNPFSEIWELPHDNLLCGPFRNQPAELDRNISQALGCHNGRFSATAGSLQWGDNHEEMHKRRHFQSKLLQEMWLRKGQER